MRLVPSYTDTDPVKTAPAGAVTTTAARPWAVDRIRRAASLKVVRDPIFATVAPADVARPFVTSGADASTLTVSDRPASAATTR